MNKTIAEKVKELLDKDEMTFLKPSKNKITIEQLRQIKPTPRVKQNTALEGLSKIQQKTIMNFGQAIEALEQGKKVAREGWNGKGMWVNLQVPDEHSKMSLPYAYMFTACKNQVPWLASQTDMFAKDWMIVE